MITCFCNLKASASACADAIVCSASTLILSRSLSAFSFCCSAVTFDSIASLKLALKSKLVIDTSSSVNPLNPNLSLRNISISAFTSGLLVINSSAV